MADLLYGLFLLAVYVGLPSVVVMFAMAGLARKMSERMKP